MASLSGKVLPSAQQSCNVGAWLEGWCASSPYSACPIVGISGCSPATWVGGRYAWSIFRVKNSFRSAELRAELREEEEEEESELIAIGLGAGGSRHAISPETG